VHVTADAKGAKHWPTATNRRGTSARRWIACALAFVATVLAGQVDLQAGCHYGRTKSNRGTGFYEQQAQSAHPRQHAREFTFLGQWIYEGGEIKYVPWQSEPLCHGPNCEADDEQAPITGAPSNIQLRISLDTLPTAELPAARPDGIFLCLASSSLFPLAGYPHEHEYPP
jgi:hypothetical protein